MATDAVVDAVIVAYDSGAELRRAVELLLQSPRLATLNVVDNASTDGSVAALAPLAAADPRLRLLPQPHNLGFGAGVNRGAAAGSAPWLLLLNPDCELQAVQLQQLLQQAERQSRLGALSCRLVFADGRPEPAALRRDPTPRRVFNQLSGLARLLQRCEGLHLPAGPGINEVEACSGALMLLPRPVFAQLGGFDEGYFLHCEDLDLCRRLRLAGHRVLVDAELAVLHHKGTSSRQRLAVLRYKQAGMLRYFEKFDAAACGRPGAALVRLAARLLFALQRGLLQVRGG